MSRPYQVLSHISGATSSEDGVSLVYSMPSRNVSLRLRGLQEKDSGSYFCSVTVQDRQGNNRSHSSKTLELDVWGEWGAHTSQWPSSPGNSGGALSQRAEWQGWRRGNGVTIGYVWRSWCMCWGGLLVSWA